MSLFPYPYSNIDEKLIAVLFTNNKFKTSYVPVYDYFEIHPITLRTRTFFLFSLRIRTVYETRTLVRVHKQYGFRPRRSGYGLERFEVENSRF